MRSAWLRGLPFVVALFVTPAAGFAQQASDALAPEPATGVAAKAAVHADRQMVVAANPLAAEAGIEVLREGGNAADAMVAVQTVLGLVEPQSSGLGGGAFLVWYDAATRSITTFDGRETAPAGATPALFLDSSGKPLAFFDAVIGGRSVGVPGVPRLMEKVQAKYGKKAWADLLTPAIALAEQGFAVSPRMNMMVARDAGRLGGQPAARRYFYDADGKALAVGATLKNPAYAATLKSLAERGADAFYMGPIARDIVNTVQDHPANPGGLSLDDLASYEVKERPAVCAPYRGYDVCGMGPPSSGGIAIGQILGMVEPYDIETLGPDDPQSWRIIGDATRLAFADRQRYVADSDFIKLPKGLLNADYLKTRSALMRRDTALAPDEVSAGEPPWDKAELRIDGRSPELPSTSHFVIADSDGNVLSMTTSVENAFGSRLFVDGFLLNNQLTDFSFAPAVDGKAVANRVEAGKRPRSSMSPTIVLEDGKPAFALGSPGGSQIIPFVAETIIALVDWKMGVQKAIAMPHLTNRFGPYDLEEGTSAVDLADDLKAFGYKINIRDLNSGLHGIAFANGGMTGGADPRREGVALAD